jgi:hypothetical protein
MSKVVLFAASLLVVAGVASAGIIDPCNSPVVYTGPGIACYFSCPQGDNNSFLQQGFSFASQSMIWLDSRFRTYRHRTSGSSTVIQY